MLCVFWTGFPSVGKSTLLTNLAGVYSEVAAYEFTTLTTVPGVIRYKGAKIQLLDLPGIIEGAKDGKGRGRQVIAGVWNYVDQTTFDYSKTLLHGHAINTDTPSLQSVVFLLMESLYLFLLHQPA